MVTQYAILISYFAILIAIGLFAARKVKGLNDFYIGGKKLGFWIAAFSAQATGESAWLLLGLTGMGAMVGVSAYWVVLGEVLGVGIAWFIMAKPFKTASDEYRSITIPDYLTSRFKTKNNRLRAISASILSIFVIIYISAQIDATGSAFESFLGWNYFVGAIVGFMIVVTYCVAGGFIAVCRTDFFQGVVMMIALAALPLAALYVSSAGVGEISDGLRQIDPNLLSPWGGEFSMLNLMAVLGMALIGLGFMGSPQIFVRFMSVKDLREIDRGKWVAVLFTLIVDTGAVTIGILGRYLLTDVTDDPAAILGNGAQDVLPKLVTHVFPLAIVGIYIAAVLSAIMSTISSLLVLASSAVTQDLYHRILHPDLKEQKLVSISRKLTLIIALVALALSMTIAVLSPDRTIFWFVIFGWSGIAASFCPMMILSIFWKSYTEAGAIASMLVGFLSVPFFKFVAPKIPEIGIYFEKLESLPPSFALSLCAGYVVSKFCNCQKTAVAKETL